MSKRPESSAIYYLTQHRGQIVEAIMKTTVAMRSSIYTSDLNAALRRCDTLLDKALENERQESKTQHRPFTPRPSIWTRPR